MPVRNSQQPASRRSFLQATSCGFGSLALSALLQEQAAATELRDHVAPPLAAKPTHFPARAKRVIFLFMSGGPSQMDLFDFKPELEKRAGQSLPYQLPETEATVGLDDTKLLGPVSKFKHAGECGLYMSELLPFTAQHA
ncbi:MAG: DUF1501 domain-containing protein, partial [Planctomycetaceae bacterium]|nr:DUF1501 domain-containing protein [Planctomycetaceae bacterium]